MLIPNHKYQTNYLQNFSYEIQTGMKARLRPCIRQAAVYILGR